jgi:hypothetical protein
MGLERRENEYGYEYFVGDCYYYCVTLGGWVLCFARRKRGDTFTARDCRNLNSRLAVDRQKTVEITSLYFLLFKFYSKPKRLKLVKQIVT